jgi:hypothetical protein
MNDQILFYFLPNTIVAIHPLNGSLFYPSKIMLYSIKNSLEADWAKTFFVEYELGTPVSLLIKIFDEVRKDDNKEMGSGVFELGAILGAKGNSKAKKMKRGGTLFVRAQKTVGSGTLRLKLSGISLTNTEGWMKKSDPFYQFTRKDVGPRLVFALMQCIICFLEKKTLLLNGKNSMN